MRTTTPTPWLTLTLALAGCGGGSTPIGTPVAIDDFCAEFVDAICDRAVRCECSPTADADCRADLADSCGGPSGLLGDTTRDRIAAGTLRYDPAAAGAALASLRASTTCDNPFLDLDWTAPEVFTFGGTLRGTRLPGEACTPGGGPIGSECADGLCQPDGGAGVCIGFVGLGGRCGQEPPVVCVDTSVPFVGFDDAGILLRCELAAGMTNGTCRDPLADGTACDIDSDCASGRCVDSVCTARLSNGAPCLAGDDCASGRCAGDPSGGVCAAPGTAPNGASCAVDGDCASDECGAGVCVPGLCGVYSPPAT